MTLGAKYERELYNIAWENGYAVMRAPSSGSGRKQPQPDLLMGYDGSIFGVEVKSTKEDRVYVNKNEVVNLKSFCNKMGAVPLIAVRWKGSAEDWDFFDITVARENEKSFTFIKGMESVELW